ncbi:MAG: hypothetical protein WCI22_05620, partial [Actinomycetota bacterium]
IQHGAPERIVPVPASFQVRVVVDRAAEPIGRTDQEPTNSVDAGERRTVDRFVESCAKAF